MGLYVSVKLRVVLSSAKGLRLADKKRQHRLLRIKEFLQSALFTYNSNNLRQYLYISGIPSSAHSLRISSGHIEA